MTNDPFLNSGIHDGLRNVDPFIEPEFDKSDVPVEIDQSDELVIEKTSIRHDTGFARWLSQSGGSIAISTNRGNRMALISWNGKQITLGMRQFDKPTGIAVRGEEMAIACRSYILLLTASKSLAHDFTPEQPGRYESVYVPTAVFNTGPLNVHDMHYCSDRLWFVNTQFDCLASPSAGYSFVPRWMPKFITEMSGQDRCHLTGFAVRDGKPAFVTAIAATNDHTKWRTNKHRSGIIMDVASHETVQQGLCMPHSPRWHDGKLWFLDAANGQFCVMDPKALNKFHVVCSLPGWTHGLFFVDRHAVVAHSLVRKRFLNSLGPPVLDRVAKRKCGVSVVDLQTGRVEGCFEFGSGPTEIFDVVFLPGSKRPTMSNSLSVKLSRDITTLRFAHSF